MLRPTMATVDLGAVRHNLDVLKGRATGAQICAVVKADGYGHGAVEVARTAVNAGATWLAVALVEEAEELRAAGVDVPILLLSEPLGQPDESSRRTAVQRLLAADVTPSVATRAFADLLGEVARGPVAAHLLVDTGMGRVGCPPEEVDGFLAHAGLRVTGAWTHLARADEQTSTTEQQLARWSPIVDRVRSAVPDAVVHAANSAGILAHPASHLDLVRAGIAMYGLSPSPAMTAAASGLHQALSLRSNVAFAKHIPAGTAVSYGHTWQAPRDGWLATLPIGYADGVPRTMSNRAEVLLAGHRFPLVGRVTMDQVMVFTGDHCPAVGDEVVLLGGDPGASDDPDRFISVDEWAAIDDTISYEIACQLTARVPRVHLT